MDMIGSIEFLWLVTRSPSDTHAKSKYSQHTTICQYAMMVIYLLFFGEQVLKVRLGLMVFNYTGSLFKGLRLGLMAFHLSFSLHSL